MGGSAKDSQSSRRRKWHYKWFAMSGVVVYHARVRGGDSVVCTSTHHLKGRLDRWYSYLLVYQITPFFAFPNRFLYDPEVHRTHRQGKYQSMKRETQRTNIVQLPKPS